MGETHRRYTNFINARGRWTGHLFQSRFASVALAPLIRAVRYVSLNPVRAGLVARAEDWRWSSVRAHMAGENDTLVNVRPVLERVQSFKTLLEPRTGEEFGDLRDAETTGRPLGTPEFIHGLEAILGRSIARRAPGRKPVRDSQPPCEQLELL